MIKEFYYYLIILFSGLFDRTYYLLTYPDVRKADIDPLWHFVKCGWKEGRDPSAYFDTEYYLKHNIDVFEKHINPLVHYILFGGFEGRNPNEYFSSSKYFESNEKANDKNINLLIQYKKYFTKQQSEVKDDHIPTTNNNYNQFREIWRRKNLKNFMEVLSKSIYEDGKITHLICLPFFSTGGAELVAINYAKAVISKDDYNVLLLTDGKNKDIEVDMDPRIIKYSLDDFVTSTKNNTKKILLYDIIITLRPKVVHNINSTLLWELFMEKGESLRKYSHLFASIFALQFDDKGGKVGYAEYYLQNAISHISGLLTDNRRFIEDAVHEYKLNSSIDKFKCIYNPSRAFNDKTLSIALNRLESYKNDIQQSEKLNCVWAGRIDREKRWELFLEIVQKCRFADFSMYGQSVVDQNEYLPNYDNLHFRGTFRSPDEVFLNNKFAAFIFTSRWEGLPNILIEAGSWGIPIIAPNVGGISELINDETGFLLSSNPDSGDYRNTLLYIRDNPEEAVHRSLRLLEIITNRHSWQHFLSEIIYIDGYI